MGGTNEVHGVFRLVLEQQRAISEQIPVKIKVHQLFKACFSTNEHRNNVYI